MASVEIVAPNGLMPPRLKSAVGELTGAHRREVYSVAGEYMANVVRSYIRSIVPQNHRTAESFTPAATPTGHLEKAARNTIYKATQNGATVQITSPGITRAFHPLNIRMKGKLLTIPARPSPEAYGKRAREVGLTERLFFAQTRSGVKMLATSDDLAASVSRALRRRPARPQRPTRPGRGGEPKRESNIRPVFWLRESVTVPQKRNILPSDATLQREAVAGVARGVRAVFATNGVPLK